MKDTCLPTGRLFCNPNRPDVTFADKAVFYFLGLQPPSQPLPGLVETMNPYQSAEVQPVVRGFYRKFFNDNEPRTLVLGINPGRMGGGTTGISFTDPVNLQNHCGIAHQMAPKTELSSRFVYRCIEAFGGAEKFYAHFHLGALYPLALVKDGKNYNYYDNAEVYAALKPEIMDSLQRQAGLGSKKDTICLGQKNHAYLKSLNHEMRLFDKIHVLDHPRFIMQYRSRQVDEYVDKYLDAFAACLR